jgi:hypothetical protein
MTTVRDEIMHIADPREMRCAGACEFCCGSGDRFWYRYLQEALDSTDNQHLVREIRNEAVDGGAPEHIVAMFDGLIRSLRTCCAEDICWCDLEPQTSWVSGPAAGPDLKDSVKYAHEYFAAVTGSVGVDLPDYALEFTERPGTGNVCWCGESVSAADTEALEAHSYCSPEQ